MNKAYRKYLSAEWTAKVQAYMILTGISDAEWDHSMRRAMAWHYAKNEDNHASLCKGLRVGYLFPDARVLEGLPAWRFYFYFKNLQNNTDWVEVADAFLTCPNYYPYLEVWQKHAPEDIRAEVFFLGSLVKMTTMGMKYEKEEIARRGLIPATGYDDYHHGVDAWTKDGEPVQLKRPKDKN